MSVHGPDLIRRPDGLLEIRVGWREFVQAWRTSPEPRHVVLDDQRPAVMNKAKDTITTPYPAIWAEVRSRLRRSGMATETAPRSRTCSQCGAVMVLHREYEAVWAFRCEICHSVEMEGKQKVGGTFGAGEKETT